MEQRKNKRDKISIIIMIVLAVLLIPVLAVNVTLIIKGGVNKDVPPDIFGTAPLTVTSGSMSGDKKDCFDKGALIFVKLMDESEKESLEAGDIVTFRLENVFVTHRIVGINSDAEGKIESVVTQGDANDITDGAILIENVIGRCTGSINGLGNFAIFLQTPVGILVFVGIPVVLFVVYDVIRIQLYNKRAKAANLAAESDKDEEIKRLRALVEQQDKPAAEQSNAEAAAQDSGESKEE